VKEASLVGRPTLEAAIDAALWRPAGDGRPQRPIARRSRGEVLGKVQVTQRFFASCRRALHLMIQGPHDHGVLEVVSPRRGDGRSTVAAVMASCLHQGYGDPVGLLDLDFEKPDLASLFGVDSNPGLADYLEGREAPRLVAGPSRQLCLVPAGLAQGDHAALYRALVERELLAMMRKRFRWVVVDLPPLLEEPAAAWLSALANWHVLVGRYRSTTLADLEEVADMVGLDDRAGFLLTGDTSRIPGFIRRLI
jgi:Mrp family chromosome partitioning ATPase